MEPQWVAYSPDDVTIHQKVRTCVAGSRDRGKFRKAQNFTKLDCERNATALGDMLQRYERVIFLGDSNIQNVYYVTLCLLGVPTVY
jgi:hypothetical protein